jgi:ubiquinone/menaquinone biosynthesis C-methylase UbiE
MMNRLLEKLPEDANPPGLILADATRLPLCAACFDAVFAVHVFHLVAGWQQAVREVRRVIHPGGRLFLGNSHRDPQSPQAEIRQQWARIIQDRAGKDQRPGVLDSNELEAHLRALGARISSWDAAQWETLSSLAETIQQIEAGVHSNTWHLSAETLHACAASLRLWARDRYGDLEQPVKTAMRFTWKAVQWKA